MVTRRAWWELELPGSCLASLGRKVFSVASLSRKLERSSDPFAFPFLGFRLLGRRSDVGSGLYGRALQFRMNFCQVGDLEVIDAVINKIEFIQFCGFIVDLPCSEAESAGERRAQLHGDW